MHQDTFSDLILRVVIRCQKYYNLAPDSIFDRFRKVVNMGSPEGIRVLITSGPTRGYMDAVRYISNKSSGRLGALIATELLKGGAHVTFVYGMGSNVPDITLFGKECAGQLALVEVETLDDLFAAIQGRLKGNSFDAIVHAMAVLDYTPETQSGGKIPSNKDKLVVTFVRTPKVIKVIRELWPRAFLVSFKLEAGLSRDALIERAYKSLVENGADLVVANNQDEISGDTHRAYLINCYKKVESQCEIKQDISQSIADVILRQKRISKNQAPAV